MKQQTQTPDTTKQYHIDCEFEGERLVDDVTISEEPKPRHKKVLVYSPKLMADILIPKSELKDLPPTKQSYVEPVGFKGTKGIWQPSYNDKAIVNGDKPQDNELICSIAGHPDYDEIAANRKLISQSKEIAKALQDILIDLHEWADYNLNEADSFDGAEKEMQLAKGKGIYERYKNAKQVLKEAGLTNE